MLLLAGWPLAVPTQSVLDLIESRISVSALDAFAGRSWPGFGTVGLAVPTAYRPWPPRPYKINKFYWPTGASRFGWGLFLTDTDGANAIEDSAFGNGTVTTPVTLHLSSVDDQGTLIEKVETSVYVMPPIPLFRVLKTDGSNASFRGMFLIAVADPRVYWWNYPCPDFNISESGGVTWATVFSTIATTLNITITTDTINSNYLQPSRAINLTNEPIPMVLDSACANVGHRFVATLDGKYKTQGFSTALAALNTDLTNNPDRTLRAGGNRFLDTL